MGGAAAATSNGPQHHQTYGPAFCDGIKLYAGAEALFLRPYFSNNSALFLAGDTSANRGFVQNIDFSYDHAFSPRFTVGIEGDGGVGARIRWFHLEQSADPIQRRVVNNGFPEFIASEFVVGDDDISIENAGQRMEALTDMKLDIWDFEVTQTGQLGCINLVFSGGGRYAFMEQTYNVFAPGDSFLLSRTTFTGAGPTVSLEGTRRLGDSFVSLYGGSRGSLLFGRSRSSSVIDNDDGTFLGDHKWFDVRGILELELGLQWSRDYESVGLFVRPGVVGQLYLGGGNARNSSNVLGTPTGDNFGLFGYMLTVGAEF